MLVAAGPAPAQTPPAIGEESPAFSRPNNNTKLTPGANSFAEGQARALLQSKGYANVSPLVNDHAGIWHGTATKDGKEVNVGVDYKGEILGR